MKNTLKLAFTLVIWSVIACSALALVNSFTAPIIEERTAEAIKSALGTIFPELKDYDSVLDKISSSSSVIKFDNAYLVKSDSETLGLAITATGPSYDSSTIMVGLTLDGKVKTIKFISNTDTKGIGTKVLDPPFSTQFDGKYATDEFKVGADVDGISGATVSSKGVANIIKTVCSSGIKYLKENNLLMEGK